MFHFLALTATGLYPVQRGSANLLVDEQGQGPTHRALAAERQEKLSWEGTDVREESGKRHPDVSDIILILQKIFWKQNCVK